MKAAVSGLVVLVFLLLCWPASAGQIIRSVSGPREVVTIVDHGHTRGRPAVQVRAMAAPKRRGPARAIENDQAIAVDGAGGGGEAPIAGASSSDLSMMATEAVTSVLRFRLLASDDTDIPDIGTDPTARELRLVGAVPDEATRVAVAIQAMGITGADSVRNELQVLSDWEPSTVLVFDDEHVQERVERALLSWPELHAADIQVAVNQGVTALTGSVATVDQRVLASTAAASASGVYLVQNRLSLLPE